MQQGWQRLTRVEVSMMTFGSSNRSLFNQVHSSAPSPALCTSGRKLTSLVKLRLTALCCGAMS